MYSDDFDFMEQDDLLTADHTAQLHALLNS
jgi:hypothetical protein